jgi:hypothetical protein
MTNILGVAPSPLWGGRVFSMTSSVDDQHSFKVVLLGGPSFRYMPLFGDQHSFKGVLLGDHHSFR